MSNSWKIFNKIFESFKKFPLFRLLYQISWAPQVYHFFLSFLGAIIYRFPSRKIKVIGVTGTKGKSTTVELISFFLEKAGYKTAFFSSVNIKIGEEIKRNNFGNSSPGRFFLQYFLKEAVKAKCQYAIVEVTSQGVVLSRHRFVLWSGAVFLNIHPEHIEAHGSFEKYLQAKLSFFRYASKRKCRFFINQNNQYAGKFKEAAKNNETVLFSKEEINLKGINLPDNLSGDFNRENIAAAWAVAEKEGASSSVLKSLEDFKGLEGRMDFVQKSPFKVVVDYAHTPESLAAVYHSLSSFKEKSGRFICVLGSAGGGRDKWKRPEMGKVADNYCNFIILTNEDPYDEDPLEILKEIEKGISQPKRTKCFKILDRKEALKKAISLARKGDVVISTGKGSERSIHIAGGKTIPWGERRVVGEILKEVGFKK